MTNHDTNKTRFLLKYGLTLLLAAAFLILAGLKPICASAATVSGGDGVQQAVTIPQPMLQFISKGAEGKLNAGQEFLTEITLKNKGTVAIERPVVTLTPSGNVTVMDNNNSSYEVKDIKPGETQTITLRWKIADKAASGANEIGISVKFYFNNGYGLVQGSDTGKILLSSDTAGQTIDQPTPNIIIKAFSYGGEPVAAGDGFDLDVTLTNTSSNRRIENLVITAEPGEGLNINGSTNVFYFKAIGAGKEQAITLPLQASPTAKGTAANVTFQFKYEYVDNEKRSQVSANQIAAIPIYQKDRFTILETILPENPAVGEEQSISVKYVNEGKGDVSNVKARIDGKEEGGSRVQYLGNFEPGKSGSINFLVTPATEGKNDYQVIISYEDANMKEQEKQIPVSFEVSQPPAPEDLYTGQMTAQEPGAGSKKAIAIGAVLLAAVLAGTVFIIRLKKKNNRKSNFASLDFDEDTMED